MIITHNAKGLQVSPEVANQLRRLGIKEKMTVHQIRHTITQSMIYALARRNTKLVNALKNLDYRVSNFDDDDQMIIQDI